MSVHEPHPGFRRLEVPVLTDKRGKKWVPGVIDVTLRHEGRTVLAESPPPGLPRGTEKTIREMAGTLARTGVAGVVTVTFFADPRTGEFRFVETAPRLPAEQALLEASTGLDLTALQLHLSRGGSLEGEPPEARGHAVGLCLSARDPEADLAPAPGIVEVLRPPSGPGLRADASVEEGDVLSAEEPGIIRVTAHGRTRAEALSRLQKGLARTVVVLRGGTTDKAFLSEILERPEMDLGTADPEWLEHLIASGEHLPRRGAEAALLEAAIRSHESESDLAMARFQSSAARGRPEVPGETGHPAELRYRGQAYLFRVGRLDAQTYRVEADGVTLEVRVGPRGRAGRLLSSGERSWRVFSTAQGSDLLVEADGIPHRISREASREEAHKEENPVRSPAGRVPFTALLPAEEGRRPAGRGLEEVRRLLLGYDADPKAARKIAKVRPANGDASRRIEEEILRIFVDVSALFRRQPIPGAGEDARHSAQEYLFTYLRDLDSRGEGLPAAFLDQLARALAHYGIASLERSAALEESLFRIAISHGRLSLQVPPVLAILDRHLESCDIRPEFRDLLDRLISETQGLEPAVHDLAREVRYRCFDRPLLLAARDRMYAEADDILTRLDAGPEPEGRTELIRALVECPQPLHARLSARFPGASPTLRRAILEVIVRRYYRIRDLQNVAVVPFEGQDFFTADYEQRGTLLRMAATHDVDGELAPAMARVARFLAELPRNGREVVVDLYLWNSEPAAEDDAVAGEIGALLAGPGLPQGLRRIAVSLSSPEEGARHFTFRPGEDGAYAEDPLLRDLHPMMAQRVQLWRLRNFRLKRLPSPELVYLFHGVAHENPKDERLVALAEVRDLTPVREASGRIVQLPQLEHMLMESLAGIRRFQSKRAPGKRLQWNRVLLSVWPPVELRAEEINGLVRRLAPLAEGLGLEKVVIRCRIPDRETGELRDWVLEISNPDETSMTIRFRRPAETPLKPLRAYAQKVVELKRRGLVYPYEIVKRLAPPRREAQGDLPPGEFEEHDLDAQGRLIPVDRPYGQNTAGVVVGVVRNFTPRYPEGMTRVLLLADPSRDMGALSEPECRRILAALDLAERMQVPVEWFALSAGAKIAGGGAGTTDWIGLVLRRIVELTQRGMEINVVVAGLNAGAQPFWNAEATMLMHTRGIVIMIPEGAMVLTGKQALDDSGGVSAEDDQGIGGYERIMGPNGQAQYFARDLGEACRTLLHYYGHTWVAPGERFPRPLPTGDPRDRDVRAFPHGGELATVGDVFSEAANPGLTKPFEIRRVMSALIDQDHAPLERWYGMRDAEIAVVWDACLGGYPVCLLGFESKPLPRLGFVPVYGPDHWTGGTLSPLSSKKVARAINAASGNRPLVILANLAGFDGSPESMRHGQLEYGAEIGRALVNFRGPIVLCILSRDPGESLAVFSASLNDNLEVAVLEGSHGAVTIAPERLRPDLIEAVERGMGREGAGAFEAAAPSEKAAQSRGAAPAAPRVSTLG